MALLSQLLPLLVAGGAVAAAVTSWRRGRARIARVNALARTHGLSDGSRRHLLTIFGHRLAGSAADQIAAVGTQRLLDAFSDDDAATEARAMRRLLFEFERPAGSVATFDAIAVFDLSDEDSPVEVHGWVTQIDEQVLHVVSRAGCPWHYGAELHARVGSQTFRVRMLMPPSPGDPTWILSHALGAAGAARRAHERVECRLEATVLPVAPEIERLLEALPSPGWDDLRRTRSWARRRAATVVDVSVEGVGLRVGWDVRRGDSYFLAIVSAGAVHLVVRIEVMSVRRTGSRLVAGARVRGTNVDSRRLLSQLVRDARAAVTAAGTTRTLAAE